MLNELPLLVIELIKINVKGDLSSALMNNRSEIGEINNNDIIIYILK